MSSDEEDQLIGAVLASPDDDAPRLVYADWLLEHGDAQLGELIVVQCARYRLELAHRRATEEYVLASLRERVLSAKNVWVDRQRRHWAPSGVHHWSGTYSRGFITTLRASAKALRAAFSAFARCPLKEIHISDSRDNPSSDTQFVMLGDLAWLASQPTARALVESGCLETIRVNDTASSTPTHPSHLNLDARLLFALLDREKIDPDDLERFWDAEATFFPREPFVEAITAIQLLTPIRDLTAIARLHADSLRAVAITLADFSAEDFTRFLAAPAIATTKELSLDSIGAAHVDVFCGAPANDDKLEHLSLTAKPRSFDLLPGHLKIASCALTRSAPHLRIPFSLDRPSIEALEAHPNLTHLFESGQRPLQSNESDTLHAFTESSLPKRLFAIGLSPYFFADAQPLARAPFERIEEIHLKNLSISDSAAEDIANSPYLATLSSLVLACGITPVGARALAQSPYLKHLSYVDFRQSTTALPESLRSDLAEHWPHALILG